MLPPDPDATEAEKAQFVLYQLKVWEKVFSQLQAAASNDKPEKYYKLLDFILKYGYALNKDWEFDLERDLTLCSIFEEARDFK